MKKKKSKNITIIHGIKILAFTGFVLLLFVICTDLLKPEWNYPMFPENVSWSLQSFYEQEEYTDDVIFIGTSHCVWGVSPMEVYKKKGIVSYNLGTSLQPVGVTFYLLKEVFRHQSPQVVVVDVSSMFFADDGSDVSWQYVLNEMPMTKNKLAVAIDYANRSSSEATDKKTLIKDKLQRFHAAVFPLVQYHTRWENLNRNDFLKLGSKGYFTNGYLLSPVISDSGTTLEQMNAFTEVMANTNIWKMENQQGELQSTNQNACMYHAEISEKNKEWLEKIKQLCEEHGAKLLLTKYPTIQYPQYYGSAWTSVRSEKMKELSETMDLPFLDLLYDVDLGIDSHTDFMDGGGHLNYLGAKKVSDYLADYLSEIYHIQPCQSEAMEEKQNLYEQLTEVALLQAETDFSTYMKKLAKKKEELLICLAACDEMRTNFTADDFQSLNSLGLKMDESWSDEVQTSYLAVVDSGNVLCEQLSNGMLNYQTAIGTDRNVSIRSGGWNCGAVASICIDGVEYACNRRGINIVVMDKKTGQVLDSVAFDTYVPEHTAVHKDTLVHLDEYWLLLEDEMR